MDSTTLRLWILFVGLLVVGVIYGWGKWQERRGRRQRRIEPAVGSIADDDDWAVIPTLQSKPPVAAAGRERTRPGLGERTIAEPAPTPNTVPAATPPASAKELILTLSVLAPRNRTFNGTDIRTAFEKAGVVYGSMRIYHAPLDLERSDGPALFSIANILEPGTLEPDRMKYMSTPGLVFFARLPAPVLGIEVFEHMQATARFLAKELGGEVCDERRQPFTPEKAEEIVKRIVSEIGKTIRIPEF